ncbi:hypothetical protein BDW62DRAFT_191992 [Aspergillus aurantiobrunneus]
MTPDSPDEALHFRGKTLTPESPRPLHVAEPTTIPVLQNQMDPVLNDTSTYGQAEGFYGNNYPAQPNGQYTGSGGVRWDQGSVHGGQEQRPPQHQSHTQGSLHSGPLLINDGLMETDTSSSVAATTAPLPPSSNPISSTIPTKPSSVEEATADSSLTAPTSDPSSLPSHPVPGAPPSSSHAAHNIPFANEVDHPIAALQGQTASQGRLDAEKKLEDHSGGNGVDFQNLLDNLPSSSTAPSASAVSAHTIPADDASASPKTTADEAPQSSLGLPPRPPPQEKPSIHPNYNPSDDIRSYHQLPAHATSNTSNPYAPQPSNYQSSAGLSSLTAGAPGTSSGAGSLPPPPIASFQQSSNPSETQDPPAPTTQKNGRVDRPLLRSDDDAPWGPDVQKKYDSFLHDERIYVTEGLWDRFPYGSRLFVGNLPTERVTKRDLFHIFHSYGKLAQISIKQAYGFIQFLEAPSCKRALEKEQGAIVRGRKVHLEISKPQRNTRPAPASSEPSRAPPPRRSRSPDYSRGGPPSNRSSRAPGDRYDRPHEQSRLPFSDFRDEPTHRRRDDYRPPRSPSPRGYRTREGYRSRDRTPERFDRRERRRSRSPYGRDRRYRSPSPRARGAYDNDADLPVPRRTPREVPDVQILVLEELDRNFVYYVEGCFRNRGLRVDVLTLGPRIPLDAAVKRQVSEGVLAVVRLSRPSQLSRKIPLQVFDRSSGIDNVRSNEYPDLEPNIAADVVFQAQSLQRNIPSVPLTSPTYGVQPLPTAPLPQAIAPALTNQPNLANAISHLDGPGLQSLLAALQQQRPPVQAAQQPFPATTNPHPTPDLASLLSAATRQPVPLHPPQQPLPQQQFPLQGHSTAPISDPNLLSLLAKGLGGHHQSQGQPPMAPNQVQNIISQLGKWKQ